MGKPSAPAAPDYAAAATAQGAANKDTAQFNAGANRVNQITPQGSSTWTIRPGADLNNPQPGDYIQTNAYSPELQKQFDQGNAITGALLDTSQQQLGRVNKVMGTDLDLSSLPAWRTSGQSGGGSGGYASQAPMRQQGQYFQQPMQRAADMAPNGMNGGSVSAVFGGTSPGATGTAAGGTNLAQVLQGLSQGASQGLQQGPGYAQVLQAMMGRANG